MGSCGLREKAAKSAFQIEGASIETDVIALGTARVYFLCPSLAIGEASQSIYKDPKAQILDHLEPCHCQSQDAEPRSLRF